jgi:hypothetical protein
MLSTTARRTVVEGAAGVDEFVGEHAGYWRATPVKFQRRRAQSRRGRGIGELEEGEEATGVLRSSRGMLLL